MTLTILCVLVPAGVGAGTLMGSSADNVKLTEYDDTRPIVVIHAKRIFEDHEKYGFFRLGLVPLAVAEGVLVQVASADRLTNALANLSSWNLSKGSLRRLEVHDLQIFLLGDPEPRVRAASARPNGRGLLELFKVSIPGGSPVVIPKAILRLTGPSAGTLCWSDGKNENKFLIITPSEPKNKYEKGY